MMSNQSGGQASLFYAFNLEDHVPQDHLLRSIDRFIDLADIRRHLAPFYSSISPPLDRSRTDDQDAPGWLHHGDPV